MEIRLLLTRAPSLDPLRRVTLKHRLEPQRLSVLSCQVGFRSPFTVRRRKTSWRNAGCIGYPDPPTCRAVSPERRYADTILPGFVRCGEANPEAPGSGGASPHQQLLPGNESSQAAANLA
jgi:hypothetical protein